MNRVWQYHFGFGLVRTPDNFGFTGEKPTHPGGCSTWLAAELVEGGWKTKLPSPAHPSLCNLPAILRPPEAGRVREDRRREPPVVARAEPRPPASTRRPWLQGGSTCWPPGGNLKLDRIGGPSFAPEIPPDALEGLSTKGAAWKVSPAAEQGRRSVYIFAKRGLLPPLLTTFDLPDIDAPRAAAARCDHGPDSIAGAAEQPVRSRTERRGSQRRIGAKLEREGAGDPCAPGERRIGSRPRGTEVPAALAHLDKQSARFAKRPDPALDALASLCHVLLNTNEFMYVD